MIKIKKCIDLNAHIENLAGKVEKKNDGTILVEVPNKQVRQFYQDMEVTIPGHFMLDQFRNDIVHITG